MGRDDFNRIQQNVKYLNGEVRRTVKLKNRGRGRIIDNRKYLKYSILMLLIITLMLSGVGILTSIMIVVFISILELLGD